MKRLSAVLYRASTGRVAFAALVVFIAFAALVLPGQAEQALAISGGAGSPDTSFLYAPADLYRMAEAYGPQGRQAYVQARFTFDAVFPLVYALCLATAVSWLCARVLAPASPWRLLNLVPVAAMAFDYGENVAASVVMLRYPLSTPLADVVAPAMTLVKWIFIGGSVVVLVILTGRALRHARRSL
jgi:hypothetical protein